MSKHTLILALLAALSFAPEIYRATPPTAPAIALPTALAIHPLPAPQLCYLAPVGSVAHTTAHLAPG